MKHLVKGVLRGTVTTRCGITTDTASATVWYSEVECPACRPYEYVREADGTLVKRARDESTAPKTRVLRRRPKG